MWSDAEANTHVKSAQRQGRRKIETAMDEGRRRGGSEIRDLPSSGIDFLLCGESSDAEANTRVGQEKRVKKSKNEGGGRRREEEGGGDRRRRRPKEEERGGGRRSEEDLLSSVVDFLLCSESGDAEANTRVS